jgi:TrmH family RNA methyltransferase
LLRSARRLSRRKERDATGEFLAEGRRAAAEALGRPGTVRELLVADDAIERHGDLLSRGATSGVPIFSCTTLQLAQLAQTVTPQGILAVCRQIDVSLADALGVSPPRLVVLCDQVRDPGNLGTVIRCADAFGADAVLISTDSVDVYNGKTVRASTGSLFHLPIVRDVSLDDIVAAAHCVGLRVLGADGAATRTVSDLAASGELAGPVLWVLGNEAWGLPADRAATLDELVALPMYGRAESLNLSTAAAVLLYATATAQRGPRSNH